MTGKQLTEMSLRLLGAVYENGDLQDDRNVDYYALAPNFLTIIQQTLSLHEGLNLVDVLVIDLDEELEISDKSCILCGVYYLAFLFATTDGETEKANTYWQMYLNGLYSIRPDNGNIINVWR